MDETDGPGVAAHDLVLLRQAEQLRAINELAAVVDRDPDLFAGWTGGPGIMTIYLTDRSGRTADVAGLRSIAYRSGVALTIDWARRSLRELKAVQQSIISDRPFDSPPDTVDLEISIEPTSNVVEVRVAENLLAGCTATATRLYGDAVVVHKKIHYEVDQHR